MSAVKKMYSVNSFPKYGMSVCVQPKVMKEIAVATHMSL